MSIEEGYFQLVAHRIRISEDPFDMEIAMELVVKFGGDKRAWWRLTRYIREGPFWDFAYRMAGGDATVPECPEDDTPSAVPKASRAE